MLGLSYVNQTSRVQSLTARELPKAVEGYLVYCRFVKCLGTLELLVFFELRFGGKICLNISDCLLSFYNGFDWFQITSDYYFEIYQIGAFFQIGFILVSDCFQTV